MPLFVPPSGGVKASDFTAKGDHLVGTGAGTYAALAVGGTNGWALVVDNTQATGMKWAAVSATATTVSDDAAAAGDSVARIKISGDTQYRALLGLDGSSNGALRFGPGGSTAPDLRLYHSASKYLTIDDGAAGAVTVNIVGTFLVNGSAVTGGSTASSTGTQTNVTSSISDGTILASNASRLGATIYNDSTAALFILLSNATSSATVYTIKVAAGGYYEVPFTYTGVIKGIWTAANGSARVTEFTS
jgi:hypothetical protein